MPVRDRASVLPAVLGSITRQVYNLKWISIYFFTNDNVDDTVLFLAEFASRFSHFFDRVIIDIEDRGVPRDHRLSTWRAQHAPMLAYAYNKCIEAGLRSGAQYLYLMDSDEIQPEDALISLVDDLGKNDSPVAAGLIFHEKSGYTNAFDENRRMLKKDEIPFGETSVVRYVCGSKLIRMSDVGELRFDGNNMAYDLDFVDKLCKGKGGLLNASVKVVHLQS